MIVGEPFFKHRAAHEFGIKQQHPAVIQLTVAIVGLADNLTRGRRCQRALGGVIASHAIGRLGREIVLHEDGVHSHLGEHVMYLAQFVKVDDTHHRVQDRCIELPGKVIGVIDMYKFFHWCTKVVFFIQNSKRMMKNGKTGRFSSILDN